LLRLIINGSTESRSPIPDLTGNIGKQFSEEIIQVCRSAIPHIAPLFLYQGDGLSCREIQGLL
jgi:hypothetical protein